MALFIILTSEQASAVRGLSNSTPFAELEPVERQGGAFILRVGVLNDLAHVAHHEYLAALPQMDSSDPSFPAEIE